MEQVYDIAVIGAGGAGQMAMLRAVLNHLKTVVFMGDAASTRKSRAAWVADVDNVPGMFGKKRPITAVSREVVRFIEGRDDLKGFLTTVKASASAIRREDGVFVLRAGDQEYRARFALLCTGTMDVQPVIQGTIETVFPFANRGDFLYCMRCDGHRVAGHRVAVIGHKGSAGSIAATLKERYDLPGVYVLTHGKPFEGDEEITKRLKDYGIEIVTGEIERIEGDPKQGMEGLVAGGREIPVTRAFVALGSIVYNELAKQLGAQINEREHLETAPDGETSVPGFYAAGDLVQGKKKQVYTAWDMAVDAVDAIDRKIRELKRTGRYAPISGAH